MGKGVLKDKSFAMALLGIRMYKYLSDEKKEFVMSKQLLRSSTAVGAMVREAQNAESPADFIHKLAIAQKECDETMYWLELLAAEKYTPEAMHVEIYSLSGEVLRMVRSAIITVKKKL